MPLVIGTTLGTYEILALIVALHSSGQAGGMGDVEAFWRRLADPYRSKVPSWWEQSSILGRMIRIELCRESRTLLGLLAFLWEDGHDCVVWDSRFGRSVFLLATVGGRAQHQATCKAKAEDTTAMSFLTMRDGH